MKLTSRNGAKSTFKYNYFGRKIKMDKSNQLVKKLFLNSLSPRALDAHKGSFGSVAIVGGDTGMLGAVLLASRATLLCGAGRVYAVFLAGDAPSVDIFHPEIMVRSSESISYLGQLSCIVIGPGLGQSKAAISLLEHCMAQFIPLLIDADALNLISQHSHLALILQQRQAQSVITPHPAEAAKLLKTSIEHVQNYRLQSAQNLAEKFKAICVLKGAGTICADFNSNWFINTSGNPGLASGGTGDVLSGIVGSLIAQGLSVMEAAKLGVYVHGAAADKLVADGLGPVGLTASEIAQEARNQINQLKL
jgi:hydroxyethylthiazole kinase-like uncharacterized protein yjeF